MEHLYKIGDMVYVLPFSKIDTSIELNFAYEMQTYCCKVYTVKRLVYYCGRPCYKLDFDTFWTWDESWLSPFSNIKNIIGALGSRDALNMLYEKLR